MTGAAQDAARLRLDRIQRLALIVGIGALVLCGAGALMQPQQFFRSYLLAFVFWCGIALGCLAVLMVQHMSGGGWGLVIRRLLEAATRTFPLLALMFVPLTFGLRTIFVWADPAAVAASEVLQHKSAYLNTWFFLGRVVFYFVVWIGIGHLLSKWSHRQDSSADRSLIRRMQVVSGPGLLLYGLTATFASVDWVMSLDPEWFSTMFGILFMGGQGVAAMAFVICVLTLVADSKPLADVLTPTHVHDLGKLMLAFVMLWAYFGFSQFLIVWAGNLPEEIPWYVRRLAGPWKWMGLAIILFHFALPFLLLLSRDLKRNARRLAGVAVVVILMRLVDLFWLVGPNFHEGAFHISWMDLAAPVGLGGVWLWYFIRELKTRPLLPLGDPYLEKTGVAEGHKLQEQTG